MIMENEGKVIFLGYIINCFGNLFFKVDEKERWEKFWGIIEWFFFIDGWVFVVCLKNCLCLVVYLNIKYCELKFILCNMLYECYWLKLDLWMVDYGWYDVVCYKIVELFLWVIF